MMGVERLARWRLRALGAAIEAAKAARAMRLSNCVTRSWPLLQQCCQHSQPTAS